MKTLFLVFIWIFVLSCLLNSTQSRNCSHRTFTPYTCQLLPQDNTSFKFPCIVQNHVGCQYSKGKAPPKDLHLETVHLISINLYNITYPKDDVHFAGETYPAFNLTFSLPSGDMLASCRAVRVNIWNNDTHTNYGRKGYCRLFDLNLRALNKTNIQPAYINHKCFTGITATRYFLKFTTLPYITEITYSITIGQTNQYILAIAPVHNQMAISIILHFPVANTVVCNKKFRLTRFQTATEDIKSSINNGFLFENLQPGFYRVRVESHCLATGQTIESDIIQLKDISEAENVFSEKIIWIALSLVPAIILIICLCRYYKWKQKCIDRSHRCVIDLLYSCGSNKDRIIAEHLQKLMEDVFEWSVNSGPADFFISDLYGSPTSNVSLYLTAPDPQGKVRVPGHYKNISASKDDNLIKILLYYKQKRNNQISVDFQPSFDIVKDIKKLFYFVYTATKNKNPVELFEETYYPKVNNIEKQTFWNGFVHLIENAAELNRKNENEWGITTQHDSIRLNRDF